MDFPKFWFEGNLSFGWVNSLDDLHEVFRRYTGDLTPKGVLDRATSVNEDYTRTRTSRRVEFGLRREHMGGKKTLREFLLEHNIEFNF